MATSIEVVPATMAHGAEVASRMREADVDEVWALARHCPWEAVRLSLEAPGEKLAFLANNETYAVFGCSKTPCLDIGSPWLLGADGVERHTRQFLRLGRQYVGRWALEYNDLINMVDARNKRSISWLGRLGFVFDAPIPAGPDACLFLPFHLRRFDV